MAKVLLKENEIKKITVSLGKKITKLFKDDPLPPVLIGVLKGATPFFVDVIKEVKIMAEIDFVQYSSYGNGTKAGVIVLKKDLDAKIKNRNVVVFEDILDSGHTLFELKKYLHNFKPKNVFIAALLDKPSRREVDIKADFVGKTIDNLFVVGYGLDYAEYYRNSKDILVLDKNDQKAIDKLVAKVKKGTK